MKSGGGGVKVMGMENEKENMLKRKKESEVMNMIEKEETKRESENKISLGGKISGDGRENKVRRGGKILEKYK